MLFSRLHTSLHDHRAMVFLFFVLWMGGIGWALKTITIDSKSNNALFPDTDFQLREMGRNLDMLPFSHLLLIQLDSGAPRGEERLLKAAERFLTRIPSDQADPVRDTSRFQPACLLRFLPGLATESFMEQWRRTVQPEALRASLREVKRLLTLGVSGPAITWLQEDPLGWRTLILPHMPFQTTPPVAQADTGFPISEDGRHLLMILNPRHPLQDVDASARLLSSVEDAIRQLPEGITARIAGGHRHTAANARTIEGDIERTVVFSLLGLALVYILAVRSWGAVWILLTPLLATGTAIAGASLLYPVLSGLSIGFAASILGVAEDYAIHMHFALRTGSSRHATIAAMEKPLTQGMLLNLAFFAVLLFSSIPALRQMATFAILTLASGWLIALLLLPLCPSFASPRLPVTAHPPSPVPQSSWKAPVLLGCIVAACALLWQFFSIDTEFSNLGAEAHAIREDMRAIQDVWGRQNEQLVVAYGATRKEALQNAADLQRALRERFPGMRFRALTDLLPLEAVENARRWRLQLQALKDGIRKTVLHEAQELGFTENAFAPFLSSLETLSHAEAVTIADLEQLGMGTLATIFLREDAHDVRTLVLTDSRLHPADLPETFFQKAILVSPERVRDSIQDIFSQEKKLFLYAGIAFTALIFVIFRHAGICILIPPSCAFLSIMLYFSVTDATLNLAGFAALPIVMGLSIDHGIIVSHERARACHFHGTRAVLVSSLTALISIGILAAARHPALQAVGQIIFLGLLGELPAALWIVPRLTRPAQESSHD